MKSPLSTPSYLNAKKIKIYDKQIQQYDMAVICEDMISEELTVTTINTSTVSESVKLYADMTTIKSPASITGTTGM